MNVIGISTYSQDSAASLISNGRLYAAKEEWFTRVKHDPSFPLNSIKFCLEKGGVNIDDIDIISYYERPLLEIERQLASIIETFPSSYKLFMEFVPEWVRKKLAIAGTIRKKLNYKGHIQYIPHHIAHAASAFFSSTFDTAAILVIDGAREWATVSYGKGNSTGINILDQIKFPHSPGLLYSAVTEHLGFSAGRDESKVMELSLYGKPVFMDKFEKLIKLKEDGSFTLDMQYFNLPGSLRLTTSKFVDLMGRRRTLNEEISEKHMNFASSLQDTIEKIIFAILNKIHSETGEINLCLAGGTFLNTELISKISKNTPFMAVYVPDAPGNDGAAIGASMYAYDAIKGNEGIKINNDSVTGPYFDNKYIKDFLKSNNIKFEEYKTDELSSKVSKLIFENSIVALVRDKMKFSSFPSGSRCLIANPCNQQMKERLNDLKMRQSFMPVLSVVKEDDSWRAFFSDRPAVFPGSISVREDCIGKIPSALRVDGSVCTRAINENSDPLLYSIAIMVKLGQADGYVSGAIHATGDVLRPAFKIIKTAPGSSTVSSFFIMALPDRSPYSKVRNEIFFADCAVIPSPDAGELADIAISTAASFRSIVKGEDPRVAMLSFSTKGSAKHPDAEKVIEATKILKEKMPELLVDGELQADAALIPGVGEKKCPGSVVAGKANILVFPDLNSGNIAYKLVQRLAGAAAIGPVVQGLNKPVNDLSRGCSVQDIIDTVAVTACQAGN